ncbi:Xin actin-binding repeat-containing protein 1 [Dissostichus eleginoides]|uniref:Xin actin-binding repeat-containing protein 1 n=1 Tax=Dissostichus eleginoides TaxID=100907 RepID=A0AAD9BB98_DISEL|nr:Xin actin-binding repeat-containing protein 1 [Dissostichus eleginoides]
MAGFGLRRTQSLKSLSGVQERSWVMPALTRWDRKSVSQLVQHYQSCADLSSIEKEDHKLQVSESCVDGGLRRLDTGGENLALSGSGRSSNLSRSCSMDFLPQREPSGTRALCALFESKAGLHKSFTSNPRLNTGSKTERDCPLQDWRSPNTSLKDTTNQRADQVEGRKAMNGLPESSARASRHSHDRVRLLLMALTVTQTLALGAMPIRVKQLISGSVRAAAIDSTGGSAKPEIVSTSGTRAKNSKMAEPARKITVSQSAHDEDNLPLPPPPPVPPRPFDYEGPFALSNLPHPPPKESFSSIQQQRQKSELKRLFKHIHPDLRASLDDVDDDEIMKALQQENTQAADAAYQCEVQSMRWIFENWTLDNIGDHPHETKKLLDDEELTGGNVRGTSSMFEHIDSTQQMSAKRQTSVRGDVRTSTWLFESQPLDSLNKLKREEGELVEAVLKDSIQPGDVTGARLLFESKPLSTLGRCNSIEDYSFLKLRSELQEQKGDVQKTVKLFQAEPCCAIKDNRGNIHEIKSICREEINSSNISTARWLFETQPLDLINKGTDGVKIIRGISLEEGNRGGVDQKRWMFETQSFDTIQEVIGEDMFEGMVDESTGEADVLNKRKLFEMQPLAALKGDSEEKPLEKEEIIAGDVKTSMWLFETQPMETLNDSYEVGRLKKVTLSAEEQGEVKGKKQMFERCSTQKNTQSKEQEIEKGDVKGFKNLFETIPLSKIAHSDEEIIEEEKSIAAGNVKGNKAMFETTPLYAIKDSSGNLHTVTTVSREELIKGKVQNYKWMFETKPLDKLAEGKGNVEVIKGITRQEDMMADVNMAKWLFETQTIDGIHSKFNQKEQDASVEEEPRKGDVKKCTWLFETQPMDILYDKSEKVNAKEAIDKTNVKSITWLFESQPLESIKDGEEYNLKLCNTIKDSVKSEVGVQTVKHVFETEPLDSIRKDANSEHNERRVSQVNFQSGDVSRVKELFESQSIDEIGSVMVTSNEQNQDEHLEKGSVHKCTWMFENCPMNQMNEDNEDGSIRRVSTVEGGDVQNKRFIFETSSLDKIHNQPLELMSDSVEEPPSNVDVKSSTMLFESLPLYAIRDKEGQFHEVTTVKKEEVMSGDVRGARWMFETKPLDAIKAEKEVYVIRAVTQEDVKKGGVKSARWKFETQPLDSLTSRDESSVRVIEDFGSNNVQLNKQIFESEKSCQKFTRMVSVTDVQQGDVRTSTWLFENQTIDSLKGELQEQGPVQAVHREDSQKGDVKRCTWLFESQPLDKIKEPEDTSVQGTEEEMPKSDVKCTTWLFETTPLDKITANSIADTLSYLYQMTFVHSSGIIIEANESRNVNMAKYQLESNKGVQIQKEEVVGGNIRNIMSQLLLKPTLKPQVSLLREVEKGKVNTTVVELPVYHSSTTINLERDTRIQNIVQMIDEFLSEDKDLKNGIIMQETAGGQAEMSVYSLICNSETKTESHVIEKGDVRSTIGNLLATANSQRTAVSCRVDENEKGNVNLYKSCIEKGDLNYLKSLHTEAIGDEVDHCHLSEEPLEIVQGDVKEAMRNLCQQKEQVERTISDVLPGDVKNTKKVFLTECPLGVENYHPKEEIIPGDILSAKQQLALMQHAVVEKEEIVAGDIKATMQSLERAKKQSMCVEREIVKPGTIYDMNLSGPEIEGSQAQKEVILAGDVKAAKKSLEFAKQQSLHLEREVIVPGKIYNLNVTAEEESSSTVMQSACSSTSRSQQTKTYPKTTENETEEVRGDVRAAIRSLQSAATEQKFLDKEDIVRAARKPVEQPKSPMSTFKPKGDSESCHDANSDRGHEFAVPLKNGHSPAQRKVSVLEVKTVPEQPAGIVGTKTVSETYEETDGFGNVFVSSVTSTFVTKQSESKPSALFEVVGNPTKYEVMTSPLIRRSARPFEEKVLSTANNEGTVFVTFSQPKEKL